MLKFEIKYEGTIYKSKVDIPFLNYENKLKNYNQEKYEFQVYLSPTIYTYTC